MITEKQREERKGYIGASDCAAVLGLSRWSTPLKVWAEKTGQIEPENLDEKFFVRMGNKLEQIVADLFEEETGLKTEEAPETVYHPDWPFLACNLDRRITGKPDEILECKITAAFKAKEWDGDEIPQEYILQGMHSLMVTGAKICHIACLIGGNHSFVYKKIYRDEQLILDIQLKEVRFWQDFVQTKKMPVTISANDSDTLYNLYPMAPEASVVELPNDADDIADLLESMKQDMKSLEGSIKQKENQLKAMIKENEIGKTGRYTFTWKNQSRTSIDADKLRDAYPGIAEEMTKVSTFRTFKIKGNK